ncbi:MAG: hypothetical protein ACKO32_01055, partial [Planctomycetia bacterium]
MKNATSTATRLTVETFPHEEGCRAYLLIDSATRQALAIDPRLDQVGAIQDSLRRHGARLTHTSPVRRIFAHCTTFFGVSRSSTTALRVPVASSMRSRAF